jgi:hypothetical protein
LGRVKEKDNFQYLEEDGRIILKWIFKKWVMRVWKAMRSKKAQVASQTRGTI